MKKFNWKNATAGLGIAVLYIMLAAAIVSIVSGFVSILQAVGLSKDLAGFLAVSGLLLGGGFLIGGSIRND